MERLQRGLFLPQRQQIFLDQGEGWIDGTTDQALAQAGYRQPEQLTFDLFDQRFGGQFHFLWWEDLGSGQRQLPLSCQERQPFDFGPRTTRSDRIRIVGDIEPVGTTIPEIEKDLILNPDYVGSIMEDFSDLVAREIFADQCSVDQVRFQLIVR